MRFIIKTIIKILILFFILIFPIGFFVPLFVLNLRHIPLWNIGIRNTLLFTRGYSLVIISASYLLATLLTISLVDKMKVRSIFLLHIPAVITGVILIGGFFLFQSNNYPLSIIDSELNLGFRSFFKDDVFNDMQYRSVLFRRNAQGKYTVYLYDKKDNRLTTMYNVSMSKKDKNSLSIQQDKNQVVFNYIQQKKLNTVKIPFNNFDTRNEILDNKMLLFYGKQLRRTAGYVQALLGKLTAADKFLFLGTLYLSLLMISIPLTYALNDGGWGFSGIIGVIFILVLLPFFYGVSLRTIQTFNINIPILARFSYLLPSIIFGFIGILIDIAVKVRGIKKGI